MAERPKCWYLKMGPHLLTEKGFVTNWTIQTVGLHLLLLQGGQHLHDKQDGRTILDTRMSFYTQGLGLLCFPIRESMVHFQQLRGGGSKILSTKPLGLHSEVFSQEKEGMKKASFYLDTSDWHFLILYIHVSYMNRLSYSGWPRIHWVTMDGLESNCVAQAGLRNSAILPSHLSNCQDGDLGHCTWSVSLLVTVRNRYMDFLNS